MTKNARMAGGCRSFGVWSAVATPMDLFYESPRRAGGVSIRELFHGSIHGGAARGSQQSSFVIGDDFDGHRF